MRNDAHIEQRRFSRTQLRRHIAVAIVLLLILVLPQPVLSSQITIAWDSNAQPEVVGYKLYYGTSSGQYSGTFDVSNQTAGTLSGLQAGAAYFFAATAYDVHGNQSNYSAEVSFAIPQGAQNQSITFNLPSMTAAPSPTTSSTRQSP